MKVHAHHGILSMGVASCLLLLGGEMTPSYAESERTSVTSPQNHSVSGVVVDEQGQPVIGASIMVKDSSLGTMSDIDGRFSIDVPDGSTLVISSIGFQTVEIPLNGQDNITVTLSQDAELLDQVVVVGYGTQRRATLTGSVSAVTGDEIKKVSAANVSNTLAGKTAGVIANVRSGEPGEDGAYIYIRGKGTLGDTSPLIVVDGIADRSFSRLNPEDIESISVLKDASAAIYGARAANGVILVTTKRGKSGKMKVNYSGSYTMSQPTRIPKMLNSYQYGTYINEYDADARHGAGTLTYSDEVLAHYKNHDDPLNYPDTDWWGEVANKWAGRTNHSLSVSGGNEKVSFYSSASYMYQDAIYKKGTQNYKQYQFTTNIDVQVTDAIHFSMDILGRQENRNRGVYDTNYLFTYFLTTFPGAAPYFPNGLPRVGYDGLTNNAAIMVTDDPGYNRYTYNVLDLKPKVRVDLDLITKGLYFETYAALDFNFDNGRSLGRPYDLYYYDSASKQYINQHDQTGKINVSKWQAYGNTYTYNMRLGYNRTFNDLHKIDAFVAYEQMKYDYNYLSGYRTNYLSDKIPELFAGSDVPDDKDNGGYETIFTRRNLFGRVNYNYNDKYLAEFTLRYDGSMNFAEGHRWGLFPAVSLGWVMSAEPFWENLSDIVSFFKLRASWGEMGNDNVSAYQYISQYKFQDTVPYFGTGSDGKVAKAFERTVIANPNITWETAQTTNLGFSSQFLDGILGLEFDWFFSKRNDILCYRNASIPAYSGMSLPAENIGKVNNHGVEFVLTYHDHAGDFNWGVTGNFTYARNKVVFMDEAADTPEWQKTEGHPIDGNVMYKALGIYQTQTEVDNSPHIEGAAPGDLRYEDTNGDKKITWDDAVRVDLTATPRIMYGLTLNGGWKGLDLNVFFQGQGQAAQIVQPTMNMVTDFYEGRWRTDNSAEDNLNARWPKACIKQTYIDTWNKDASTWWQRSANFVRLKSVEIGYTLPKVITSKIGLEAARLYINGSNLFTIDNFKIADPEVGNAITSYPLQRSFTFGANITF